MRKLIPCILFALFWVSTGHTAPLEWSFQNIKLSDGGTVQWNQTQNEAVL